MNAPHPPLVDPAAQAQLDGAPAAIPSDLRDLLARSPLKPLQLGGRTLLPIFQGGMGVGVSGHKLAGAVAAQGGVGTLSSVDLRRHHPDLMAQTSGLPPTDATKALINAANLQAIDREVRAARELSQGRGLLAINVMRAVADYAASVQQALASGIDAIVVGAGLPLDLPDLAANTPTPCSSPSCRTRAACSSSSRSGSAKSACPTPSSSSTRAWPAATSGRRRWAT